LAILNSELSSNAHDLLKRTLKNSTVILEQTSDKKICVSNKKIIYIANVIFKESIWYVEGLNIEMRREELVELNNRSEVVYKRLG